jgi:1-deoxy-D-xylulose-5-phosphate synthase
LLGLKGLFRGLIKEVFGIVGEDGKTHQGIFDIAFLLTIPKMVIISPTTCKELTEALEFSRDYSEGPIAIRLPRANCFNIENNKKLEFGKWNIAKEGKRDLIIATGSMLEEVLKIEKSLEKEGVTPTIVAAAFINPLDHEFIINEFPKYDRIFVLEEGIKKSGFGSYILEFLNDNGIVKNVNRIALNHEFIEHGSRDELLEECGLRGKKLIKSILEGS